MTNSHSTTQPSVRHRASDPQDGHQFEMAQTNLHPDAWTLLGGRFRPDPKEPTLADLYREITALRSQLTKEKS